ncbi:aminotransferase [Limtongia smithiae]|uniref:aminotransferase n=1 Tax=Limtongia smithiae TaxID=1125753 RepID=UPI0034CDFE0B
MALHVASVVRYDPALASSDDSTAQYFLFQRHVSRLNTAHAHFWPAAAPTAKDDPPIVTASALAEVLNAAVAGAGVDTATTALRLKVLLSETGEMHVSECGPVPERVDMFSGLLDDAAADAAGNSALETPWAVYLDTQPTEQSDVTLHKTSVRDVYAAARERVLPADAPARIEVLLHNPRREITEGSIANVAFLRGGEWVTPSSAAMGGLMGAVRSEMLARGVLRELLPHEAITVDDVVAGEKVLLLNGVQGVTCGRIVLGPYVP